MNLRSMIPLVLTAFGATHAFASGNGAGNGGNAVVCTSGGKATSIELFDYWEGAQAFPQLPPVDLGAETLSIADKVNLFIQRVRVYDVERADRYAKAAKIILASVDSYLVDQLPEVGIDDDTPRALPTGNCEKIQFAVQYQNPAPGQRRFFVSRALFNDPVTTNTTRAGILLHEIVYRDAIQNDFHDKSDGTRLMNYVYAGPSIDRIDAVELREWYRLAGMNYMEKLREITIQPYGVRALVFDPALKKGTGPQYYDLASPIRLKGAHFETYVPIADKMEGLDGTTVSLYQTAAGVGTLRYILVNKNVNPTYIEMDAPSGKRRIVPRTERFAHTFLEFDENGERLTRFGGPVENIQPAVELRIDGNAYPCEIGLDNGVYFDSKGGVRGCAIPAGKTVPFPFRDQTIQLGCLPKAGIYCDSDTWEFPEYPHNTVRMTSFYESGALESGYTHYGIDVPLAGSGRLAKITGRFVLTEKGEVQEGCIDTPTTWENAGFRFALVDCIEYDAKLGGYLRKGGDGGVAIEVSDADPAQRAFAADLSSGRQPSIRAFCDQALGVASEGGGASYRETIVTAPKEYYDVLNGKYRTYVDEITSISPILTCHPSGAFTP